MGHRVILEGKSSDFIMCFWHWSFQNTVFYEGRVAETLCFVGIHFCNLYFYYVFLTLELLKHCVLRGSSFSNTVFCGGKFSWPAVFHWFLNGRCHGCLLFASKTRVRRPGADPGIASQVTREAARNPQCKHCLGKKSYMFSMFSWCFEGSKKSISQLFSRMTTDQIPLLMAYE